MRRQVRLISRLKYPRQAALEALSRVVKASVAAPLGQDDIELAQSEVV
jgi:hypothetical protein